MSLRRLVPPLLLGLALATTACQAPRAALRVGAAVPQAGQASLTARLGAGKGYAVRYLNTTDWEEAHATLSLGAVEIATGTATAVRDAATGERSAAIAFADVPVGSGYALDVRLKRRDAAGTLVEVGWTEATDVALVAGANDVALPAPTFLAEAVANPGEPAGYVDAYVASWPAAGPGGRLDHPEDAVVDGAGNTYVSATQRHQVLKIDPDGEVSVLAGDPGGIAGYDDLAGPAARFNAPTGLCMGADGFLYVADRDNHAIRRIDLATHEVSTVAGNGTPAFVDGLAADARFDMPNAIAEGEPGAFYIADTNNNRIRHLFEGDGGLEVDTLAGQGAAAFTDGAGPDAQFDSPTGVAVGGDHLYVADRDNQRIRAVYLGGAMGDPGDTSTVAGTGGVGAANGGGPNATFNFPLDVAVIDGAVLVADSGNRRIRRVDDPLGAPVVATHAGDGDVGQDDGTAERARFVEPCGLSVIPGSAGLLVADREGARLRTVEAGAVAAIAGDGAHGDLLGATTGVARPLAGRVAFEADGDAIVTDLQANRIWHLTAAGAVTAFSGTGVYGDTPGAGAISRFRGPAGIVRRPDGKFYVADTGNNAIRLLDADGTSSVYAGTLAAGDDDGAAAAASFRQPYGLALAGDGTLYVAEQCGRIRAISGGVSPMVSTIAGADDLAYVEGLGGVAGPARFNGPSGLALLGDQDLLVADTGNHRLRRLRFGTAGWETSLVGGTGASGHDDAAPYRFDQPADVAVDEAGVAWVADLGNRRVRRIQFDGDDVAGVRTIGAGEAGYQDGPAGYARFEAPLGLAFAPSGLLFVADRSNGWLRTIRP